MAYGLTYLITDKEKDDIETILESGDYKPNDWVRGFLGNMMGEEYIQIGPRTKLDEVLKQFGFRE